MKEYLMFELFDVLDQTKEQDWIERKKDSNQKLIELTFDLFKDAKSCSVMMLCL